jgi:hypothetical protein
MTRRILSTAAALVAAASLSHAGCHMATSGHNLSGVRLYQQGQYQQPGQYPQQQGPYQQYPGQGPYPQRPRNNGLAVAFW